MTSPTIKFRGTLPKIEPDYLRCIYIYLVRGPQVLARSNISLDGSFSLALSRRDALAEGPTLQAVLGPAGMEKHLEHLPNLQRVSLKTSQIEKSETELRIPTEGLKISEEVLKLW